MSKKKKKVKAKKRIKTDDQHKLNRMQFAIEDMFHAHKKWVDSKTEAAELALQIAMVGCYEAAGI